MKIVFPIIYCRHNFTFSLAASYLKAYLTKSELYTQLEFNELNFYLNDKPDKIIRSIIDSKPDIIAISCYLWNMHMVLQIIPQIKERLPGCFIILGGPEFSSSSPCLLKKTPQIDYIVIGEGEQTFKELIEYFLDKDSLDLYEIKGLLFKDKEGNPVTTGTRDIIQDINEIASPFLHGFVDMENSRKGVITLETQRGCTQHCAYCSYPKSLSNCRYFSLDRVYKEIEYIMRYDPESLYLMDPTFNSNRKRAKCILDKIIQCRNNNKSKFTLNAEMIPEFMDEELIKLSKKAGMVQVEIGIQSLNPKAISLMGRYRNEQELFKKIDLSVKYKLNIIPQIIFGLPGDNIASFLETFDKVYAVPTKRIDVFRLLLLPGTQYRIKAELYGIIYKKEPPYYIIESGDFTKEDIRSLCQLRDLVVLTMSMKAMINKISETVNKETHKIFMLFIKLYWPGKSFSLKPLLTEYEKAERFKIIEKFYQYLCDELNLLANERIKRPLLVKLKKEKEKIKKQIVYKLLQNKKKQLLEMRTISL